MGPKMPAQAFAIVLLLVACTADPGPAPQNSTTTVASLKTTTTGVRLEPTASRGSPVPLTVEIRLDFTSQAIAVGATVSTPFGLGPDTLGFSDTSDDDLLPLVPVGFAVVDNRFVVSDPAKSRLVWIDEAGHILENLPFDQSIEDVVRAGPSQVLLVRQTGVSLSPTLSLIDRDSVRSTFDVSGPPDTDLIVGELVSNGDAVGGWFFSLDEPATYDGMYQLSALKSTAAGLPHTTGLCDESCVDLRFTAENALRLSVDDREFAIEFHVAEHPDLIPFVSLNSTQVDHDTVVLLIRAAAHCVGCESYFLLSIRNEDVNVGKVNASAVTPWDPMIRSRLRVDQLGGLWLMDLDETRLTLERLCPENSDDPICQD